MDRIHAMSAFVAVADLRGFTPAARKLGLSAPAVTRLVAALEEHLQLRLLQRTTRAVALTDAAARYLDQARRSPAAQARAARDAAYAFMSAMAGDNEHFEEASRALFAGDRPTFERLTAKWPKDVLAHIHKLENP